MKMPLRLSLLSWRLRAIALLLLNRHDQALRCFDAMLSIEPANRYALASKVHVLAQLGRRAQAIEVAEQLTQAHGDHAAGWFNLGYLLHQDAQWQRAETAFRRALALDEVLDRAWYGMSLALIELGRLDEAVQALQQNTKLQPMSPFGWSELAKIHVQRQETEEAVKIIRHLRGFEPKVAAQLERETGLRTAQTT